MTRRRVGVALATFILATIPLTAVASSSGDPHVGVWTEEAAPGAWVIIIDGPLPDDAGYIVTGYGLFCDKPAIGAYMAGLGFQPFPPPPVRVEIVTIERCDEGAGHANTLFDLPEFSFEARPDGNLDMHVGPGSPFTWIPAEDVGGKEFKELRKVGDVHDARAWMAGNAHESLDDMPGTYERSDGSTVVIDPSGHFVFTSTLACDDGMGAFYNGSLGADGAFSVDIVTPTITGVGDFVCHFPSGDVIVDVAVEVSFLYHPFSEWVVPAWGGDVFDRIS